MFRADELLLALLDANVAFVVIGGIAVGVHGYVRATDDLDIVPDPGAANLARLARVLREVSAAQVGLGDFSADEFPLDPLDPAQLAEGGNFRLTTDLGPLDIMQWVAGIESDPAYPTLASEATVVPFRERELLVCGVAHLRAMKTAAGRPRDLDDLQHLADA